MTAVSQMVGLFNMPKDLKEDEEMLQRALTGPGTRGEVIGMKVTLLSGRCCSEVFWDAQLRIEGDEVALRRCAASLGLDPDYVRSSVASSVWRRLGHLQSRKAWKLIH